MTPRSSDSLVDRYLRKPHLLTSLVLLAAVVGFVGYRRMPVNLFPDSERPQIAVVTVYPGASAEDVEAERGDVEAERALPPHPDERKPEEGGGLRDPQPPPPRPDAPTRRHRASCT